MAKEVKKHETVLVVVISAEGKRGREGGLVRSFQVTARRGNCGLLKEVEVGNLEKDFIPAFREIYRELDRLEREGIAFPELPGKTPGAAEVQENPAADADEEDEADGVCEDQPCETMDEILEVPAEAQGSLFETIAIYGKV